MVFAYSSSTLDLGTEFHKFYLWYWRLFSLAIIPISLFISEAM